MKSTVLELKTQNKESFKIYRDTLTSLLTTLSESDKLRVEQTFSEKSSYYSKRFRDEKSKKFSFLTEKQDISVQKIKKRNRPGLQTRKKWKKRKRKEKRRPLSVVFNYSSFELSDAMISLLNRGLNFCVKPLGVDLSKLLTDFKKFERKMLWKEFFSGEEQNDYQPPLFKTEKTNLPKQKPPKGLDKFLHSVESKLFDKSRWNRQHLNPNNSNISQSEQDALKQLAQLQRDRLIVIKPCDKGAGIIVLDYEDYEASCLDHLNSLQTLPDGSQKLFYDLIDEKTFLRAKKSILELVNVGKEKDLLSPDEVSAMDPSNKVPAKFYNIFKVHKEHAPGSVPPCRPIVSGNNSHTENISKFVDFHIKKLVPNIPSYIEDTPDFLRCLEDINNSCTLPPNAILLTIDVSALYTNIPHTEGLQNLNSFISNFNLDVPSKFLVDLTEMILTNNIFEFDGKLYQQAIGCAMGTPCAVSYANIFMSFIDSKIKDLAKQLNNDVDPLFCYKRYIDDIFIIWSGSVECLDLFLTAVNNVHHSIKFTSTYTCPFTCNFEESLIHDCFCKASCSLPFLDTKVSVRGNKLITDLYRKPTDRCQYLLPQSCHPSNTTKNIPYSLAYRLVRICSERSTLLKRFDELEDLLLSRQYNVKIVRQALERAKLVPREEALKRVEKGQSERVVFALEYHPALPDIKKILHRDWVAMTKDPCLKQAFPKPPMVAFKRPRSLKDI